MTGTTYQHAAVYAERLQEIWRIRSKIMDIHPLLKQMFPVAVVEGNQFLVYDLDLSSKRYVLAHQAPTPMPVSPGVRAAFPLECYGGRVACIVTGEVFDSLAGYVTIWHEFVHCYQWETCESRLREELEIARQAVARNDPMWELNYPFPYGDQGFTERYTAFLQAATGKPDDILACRTRLQESLVPGDLEYMIWQEWKEGLARYIENRIRSRLGLEEHHGGREVPFDRVSFYEGGARLIAFLGQSEPGLLLDIEALFARMRYGQETTLEI